MTCSKWAVTVFALIILALTIWPSYFSANTTKWLTIISVLIIAIVVWAGTVCKCNIKNTKKK
jgi:hypothetical protein